MFPSDDRWMRERLAVTAPALPEPVVLKLLDMEAGELDLILQYPQAAAAQVHACCRFRWTSPCCNLATMQQNDILASTGTHSVLMQTDNKGLACSCRRHSCWSYMR